LLGLSEFTPENHITNSIADYENENLVNFSIINKSSQVHQCDDKLLNDIIYLMNLSNMINASEIGSAFKGDMKSENSHIQKEGK
jgi:hypothetical protein